MNKAMRKRIARCHRMAAIIDAKMQQRLDSRYPVADTEHWTKLNSLRRQYNLAINRGWIDAAKRIRRKSYAVVETLRREINSLDSNLTALFEPTSICSPRDVCSDLLALSDCFSDVEFDCAKQLITVTTEPIELDAIYLGPFSICLDLKRLDSSSPYTVIAVDPHPASSCDSTLHPHVQSESLCEGEGSIAIRRALADGRIYDFFAIVRQILRTYNPSSAYITTEDWYGTLCGDCGATVNDSASCYGCGEQSCSDCVCGCESCNESFCGECAMQCECCDAKQCDKCLQQCERCDERFCKQCLTENQCDTCIEEDNDEAETKADTPEPAVHAVCSSQVDVPT